MAQTGMLDSAHDCSDGGIAVTLVESGFTNSIGLSVDLTSQGLPPEFILFGEDASRVVISCDRDKLGAIQQVAVKYGIAAESIGETAPGQVEIRLDGRMVVSAQISELRQAHEGSLQRMLQTQPDKMAAD